MCADRACGKRAVVGRSEGAKGHQRGQSEGASEGHQRAIRSQRAIEGTHAPSEVESIATPRAFVWRIGVRSSQVAGRLIRRHTLHRGYHVVIVATSVVVRDEEESLVPAGARTCHIRKAYAMSVQSSGNQRAMRRQSEGDEMVIRGRSASPRTQCFIDVLEEALAFGHVIARVVARLPSRVISMQ